MTLDCTEFRERIFDDLAPESEAAFRRHAAGCAACAEALESVREQEEMLRRARVPSAPEDLWARIEASVPAVRPRAFRLGPLAAAAAVLIAAVALLLAPFPSEPALEVREVEVDKTVSPAMLGGLIPGFEEPDISSRVAGALMGPREAGD